MVFEAIPDQIAVYAQQLKTGSARRQFGETTQGVQQADGYCDIAASELPQ
jgi:hypothetical protein